MLEDLLLKLNNSLINQPCNDSLCCVGAGCVAAAAALARPLARPQQLRLPATAAGGGGGIRRSAPGKKDRAENDELTMMGSECPKLAQLIREKQNK